MNSIRNSVRVNSFLFFVQFNPSKRIYNACTWLNARSNFTKKKNLRCNSIIRIHLSTSFPYSFSIR